ncbi:uncharacterized protein LOC116620150 isoform X1 [Nematostella vectensis]|uniref:uncharacterized protein LOC116620150 isoform X1 n=1 Tax=Nematostella vectensis TaxID=45351 RepID=UPI0020771FBF|nr:uncharacterized protein LOC116620150 isoform X1 [Nematostella vectensis]
MKYTSALAILALLIGAAIAEENESENVYQPANEKRTDDDEGRSYSNSLYYNYYDEIATSVCSSVPNRSGMRFAVRRKCPSTSTCQQICTGAKVTAQLQWSWTKHMTFDCIESLHIYKNRPVLSPDSNADTGKIGLLVWRYHTCNRASCGPNYCCCQKR